MKRILLIFLAALWLMPNVAMAHSKLEIAVPAQDATVTTSPQLIDLTFNTKVEKLSNFKLLNAAGEQIATDKAIVDGTKMSGAITEPLTNGIYTVKWTIIGADGHSVEGDYSFSVEAPAPTVTPSTEPDASPNPTQTTDPSESADPSVTPNPLESTSPPTPNVNADTDKTSTNYMAAIIIGVIIIGAAAVLLSRRRKK